MSKDKKVTVQQPKANKFSKAAFLDAAESPNERIVLEVVLDEKKKYSQDEVKELVADWKTQPATETTEKGVGE